MSADLEDLRRYDAAWRECIRDGCLFVLGLLDAGQTEQARRVLQRQLFPAPRHVITDQDIAEAKEVIAEILAGRVR